jgi:hypothetical protein
MSLKIDKRTCFDFKIAERVQEADVAQTVEQLIRNQQVSSSILLIGSIKSRG